MESYAPAPSTLSAVAGLASARYTTLSFPRSHCTTTLIMCIKGTSRGGRGGCFGVWASSYSYTCTEEASLVGNRLAELILQGAVCSRAQAPFRVCMDVYVCL
jgi:hypothetical protein